MLVFVKFLDTALDVKLTAGMDGSVIVDGTEYCPGKQGINIVSLDFINFKYSKGLVVQPEKFKHYLKDSEQHTSKKWDPIFLVTQGDCTLRKNPGRFSLYAFENNSVNFLLYSKLLSSSVKFSYFP